MRKVLFLILILILAACAPADLDVTPTATPTPPPTATPTPPPTPTTAPDADPVVETVSASNEDLVAQIVEAVPGQIISGTVTWQRDTSREPQAVRNVEGGYAETVFLSERSGGQAEVSFGIFDTPEAAEAHFARILDLRSALENSESRDGFPENNRFGQGLTGRNAIMQEDNVFVDIQIPIFSSTAADPLPSLARQALEIAETALTAEPEEAMVGDVAEPADLSNEQVVEAIVAGVPAQIISGTVTWRLDASREPEAVRNVEGGTAQKVFYSEPAGGQAELSFGIFDTPEAAEAHFTRILDLRSALENSESRDGFPENNRFGQGLTGRNAILQEENFFVDIQIPIYSSTGADPLPGLARESLDIVETGLTAAAAGPSELAPELVAILDAIPETVTASGMLWNRGEFEVSDEAGTVVTIPFDGDGEVTVQVGIYEDVAATQDAYGEFLSDDALIVQVGTLLIATSEGESALPLMGEILNAVAPTLSE